MTIRQENLGVFAAGGLGWYANISVWNNDLALMAPIKTKLVRANFDVWSGIEPSDGVYSWTKLDSIVDACVANGVELILTMPISSSWNLPVGTVCPYSAPWGSTIGCTHFPSTNDAVIASFYQTVAARYVGRVRYFEVWNEPDFGSFWKGSLNPSAQEYITFLRRAYNSIKAGNPNAQVLNGGLAFPEGLSTGLQDLGFTGQWLDEFFRHGGGNFLDIFNVHIYPAFATFQATLDRAVQKMQQYDVRHKKIWVTETSTTGAYFDSTPGGYSGNQALIDAEEYQKALWLVKNYTYFFSRTDTESIVWHTLRNPGPDVSVNEFQFGLMRYDATVLPAYMAHQVWSNKMVNSVSRGNIGLDGLNNYIFDKDDGTRTQVLWMDSGSRTVKVPLVATTATQSTIYGVENTVRAGQELTITTEPRYLTYSLTNLARRRVSPRRLKIELERFFNARS